MREAGGEEKVMVTTPHEDEGERNETKMQQERTT